MIQTFLTSLRATTSNDRSQTRRRHIRRETDRCVAVIGGHTFPVENWSSGGVLVAGDDRLFSIGQTVHVTLKFKLRNAILDVPLDAQVVRKNAAKVAMAFEPLTSVIRRAFTQVVDDAVAREFANSQAT